MLCRSGWLARRSFGFAGRPQRVPLPTNSTTALAAIFPDARSDMQKRYCLRLLQKTLKPGVFDVAMIVAQLCFWREEQDGKLQYTHEEGVVSL